MKAFFQIMKTEFYSYLAYRLNFILWRIRNFFWLLFLYFFWKAVFSENITLFGYNKSQIFLYILIAQVVSSFVLSTTTGDIGGIINEGRLTTFLLMPYSFFKIIASRELVDKLLNLFFSFGEITIFFLLFRPEIGSFDIATERLILFFVSIFLAVILYFFISLNLGFIGFWSRDVWAPRFLFMVLVWLLAGNYFPLDILPPIIYKILILLPFAYLIYFPVKILIGGISIFEIYNGLGILFIWTIIFYFVARFVWHKGLKVYTAQGI